jgi:hypothetical protein
MEIQIEKGIAIPMGKNATYPFRQMEVGDSFLIPGKTTAQTAGIVTSARMRTGWKFATRTTPDGVRIWRTA